MKLFRLLSPLAVAGFCALACGDVHSDLIAAGPPAQNPSCTKNSECPSGQACLSGACVKLCFSHRDCPDSAPACDIPSGRCGPCTATAEEACSGRSASHCDVASGTCRECLSRSDCGLDDPDRTICSPRGRCVECLAPDVGGCEREDEECSDALGECARPCTTNLDCLPSEPICYEPIGNFCVECTENRHCGNGVVCRGFECLR